MTIQATPPRSSAGDAFHDEVRAELEDRRDDRRRLIDELAPFAAPNLDPVAYTRRAAAQEVLGQIEAALARLDDGSYGACLHCGDQVPRARLEIVPHTDSCVGCQDPARR